MQFEYRTKGTCSQRIIFDVEDNILKNVQFIGGCNGNLKAIATLLEGKSVEEITGALLGNTCGRRSTSCADQLTRALAKALESEAAAADAETAGGAE